MIRLPMLGAMPPARSPARPPVARRAVAPLSAALLALSMALALSGCGAGPGSASSAPPETTAGAGDASANPSADTDPNKGDKYDDTPALSSVQVYSAGFPEKEAWRFWLGSSIKPWSRTSRAWGRG